MRDQYDDHTIAVEITVRHTSDRDTVERRHELVHRVGSDGRPQWLNRRVVAAVESAINRIYHDFSITDSDIDLARAHDFVSARTDSP